MRTLCFCLLFLVCSISYGQTSVIVDVPSSIVPTATGCLCTDCICADTDVVVEVERTGFFARLRGNRGGDKGPSFLLRIFKRRADPPTEVEGKVAPETKAVEEIPVYYLLPPPRVSVSVRHPFSPFYLRGF